MPRSCEVAAVRRIRRHICCQRMEPMGDAPEAHIDRMKAACSSEVSVMTKGGETTALNQESPYSHRQTSIHDKIT